MSCHLTHISDVESFYSIIFPVSKSQLWGNGNFTIIIIFIFFKGVSKGFHCPLVVMIVHQPSLLYDNCFLWSAFDFSVFFAQDENIMRSLQLFENVI